MLIPDELFNEWKNLRSRNDTKAIAEKSNTGVQNVRRVFRTGNCSDELFSTMADFYKEKADKIKSYSTAKPQPDIPDNNQSSE